MPARKKPWEQKRPAKRPKRLTEAEKARAAERARRAGRRYPNLVDNMAVLRERDER
ncbi:MAG TPA: hypothetical protein VM734_10555 [Kofleriaceae bacterium]|nr:hypothetical protein [Kofleriaceae bacterium]